MKITIDVSDTLFDALVSFNQLTAIPVNKQIDEALEDYVACVVSARMENLRLDHLALNWIEMKRAGD